MKRKTLLKPGGQSYSAFNLSSPPSISRIIYLEDFCPGMSNVLLTGILAFILYCLSLIYHRRVLTSLRDIPGPVIGRFSVWWHLWHLYNGDYHLAIRDVHKLHGKA